MKKILFLALLAFGMTAKAQITLEHDYDSAATSGNTGGSQLMIINFEVSGEQYVKINQLGKVISIYDMNHSLLQNISLAALPVDNNNSPSILYISENLFNLDSKKEFMYVYYTVPPSNIGCYVTNIYNEDGVLLFADTAVPMIKVNYEQQQLPIYNTSYGTKMILSYPYIASPSNGHAKVFSLPGTLTTAIAEVNNNLIAMQTQSSVSNAYPNPTNNATQIDYTFPDGVNEGEIVFYDLQGNEVKRFKVDKTFNTLLVSTSDITAGTYYYQLQTTGQNSDGKKLIVIK